MSYTMKKVAEINHHLQEVIKRKTKDSHLKKSLSFEEAVIFEGFLKEMFWEGYRYSSEEILREAKEKENLC